MHVSPICHPVIAADRSAPASFPLKEVIMDNVMHPAGRP